MQRPLRGLKVLDLGNFLAGPVVSMHLAAMGADVIKLERITGDDSRAIGPMAADGFFGALRVCAPGPGERRLDAPSAYRTRATKPVDAPILHRSTRRRELVLHVG